MPDRTIREQLIDKVIAAWGDGYTASVLTANGLDADTIRKTRLMPSDDNIVTLSLIGKEIIQSEKENGSYAADEPIYRKEYRFAIRCRANGISDDDDLDALTDKFLDYFRVPKNGKITDPAGRVYQIQIGRFDAISVSDTSFEQFEILMTIQ